MWYDYSDNLFFIVVSFLTCGQVAHRLILKYKYKFYTSIHGLDQNQNLNVYLILIRASNKRFCTDNSSGYGAASWLGVVEKMQAVSLDQAGSHRRFTNAHRSEGEKFPSL